MIHVSQTFVASVMILIAAMSANCRLAVAQDQFIGENQPVNRVIQLRSQARESVVPTTSAYETSRNNQDDRVAKMPMAPPKVAYDEIVNPGVLRETGPKAPMASTRSKSAGQTTQATLPNRSAQDNISIQKSISSVVAEIKSPSFVNLNQSAPFVINLRNLGTDSVENVKLIAKLPAHTQLESASPAPSHSDGQSYEFSVATMAANGVHEITLNLVPTEKKPFEISTHVVVENQQRTSIEVRQPVLSLVLNGPKQTNIGQIVTHELVVTNDGDGIATDVHLDALFPENLELLRRSNGPIIPFIAPGKTVRVAYQSQALEPGPVQLKINARADGIEAKMFETDFNIYQPALQISAAGPKLTYVQRDGIYTIAIDNTGPVDVTNIQVSLVVPSGMTVTTISRQASVDEEKGILTWTYPSIAANTKERIQLKATAVSEGVQACNIQVSSNETPAKEIQLLTQIATRADLSVRIKNLTGPVQIGGKAEFLVEVENQGSRRANEVNVRIALPETLMAVNNNRVSVDQPEEGIAFVEPVVSPGQKVTFKFTAVGVIEGEHVVRCTLQADGSARQVISEDTVLVHQVAESRVSESLSGEVKR